MVSPTNGAGSAGVTCANTVPERRLRLLEGNGAGHLQQLPGAGTGKEEVGRLGRVKLRAAPHRRPRPERDRRAQSGRGPFQYMHPGKGSGRNGAELGRALCLLSGNKQTEIELYSHPAGYMNRLVTARVGAGVGRRGHSCVAARNVNWRNHFGKTVWHCLAAS